jgi:hypothetical protein
LSRISIDVAKAISGQFFNDEEDEGPTTTLMSPIKTTTKLGETHLAEALKK